MTAEGKGSSHEGPISQDWKSVRVRASRQPAAIFAIEDQCPPCPPGGGGAARGGRGTAPGSRRLREGERGAAGRARAGGRAGRAGPGGLSSAWRRPLRAWAASPAPPSRATVETELGQPAGARALWLPALASLIYPRSPRRGRGRGGGGGGGAGTRRLRGWGGGRSRARAAFPGRAGRAGRRPWVGSGRAGRQSRAGTGRAQPSIQGREELPKSASPAPAAGRAEAQPTRPEGAPQGTPGGPRAAPGAQAPAERLARLLRGYFFLHNLAGAPKPFSQAEDLLPA